MAFNKSLGPSRGPTGALGGIRRRACGSRTNQPVGSDAARYGKRAGFGPGFHPDPLAGTRYGTGSPKSDWQLSHFPSPFNQRSWLILGAANVELLVSTTECLRWNATLRIQTLCNVNNAELHETKNNTRPTMQSHALRNENLATQNFEITRFRT